METEKSLVRPTCVAVANPDDPEVRSCPRIQNVLFPPPLPRNCHSSSIVHDDDYDLITTIIIIISQTL